MTKTTKQVGPQRYRETFGRYFDDFKVGDTLYGESEVIAKRESKSRPGQGIVTVKTIGLNQDGAEVCSFLRNVLVPAAGGAVEDRVENY